MERIFAHGVLFSATVIAGYMLLSPPGSLSAQSDFNINESIHVRKAVLQDVDLETNVLIVELEEAKGFGVPVVISSTTTVMLGNGNETYKATLQVGMPVYVFGTYNGDTRTIDAEKIVIRNKRITERTTLSRAEIARSKQARLQNKNDMRTSTLEPLGLLRID
jgi:hypothetical protein